jgi:hypothetical protein
MHVPHASDEMTASARPLALGPFLLVALSGQGASHAKQHFTALKLRSPSGGHFRCAVGPFRYQPFPHVSGKAKLLGFSDGFGSHRSGRQLSCLRQSLRCLGSPIVTIEIVARQFCHVILLTVALESQHGPPQCFAPLYAADTWDNKAAPPGEMIGPWLVNRASLPPAR